MTNQHLGLRDVPSGIMTLSRRGPKPVYQGDKLIVREVTETPRVITMLRSLADGRIVELF